MRDKNEINNLYLHRNTSKFFKGVLITIILLIRITWKENYHVNIEFEYLIVNKHKSKINETN